MNPVKILSPSLDPTLTLNSPGSRNVSLFVQGEILEGFVVRQIDPHHLVMRIQKQEFWAETQVPLPTGTKFSLQVEEIHPRVILRILPGDDGMAPEMLALIKRSLPLDLSLNQLASRFVPLLSSPDGKMPAKIQEPLRLLLNLINRFSLPLPANPETIREIILSSGIFWESRLKGAVREKKTGDLGDLIRGDLKGLLSILKQELEGSAVADTGKSGARQQIDDLLKGVDSYLRKIELYQLLNVRSPEEGPRFHLLLPLMFGQDLGFGELHLDLPEGKKGASQKEESLLTFLLNWPEGGRIRVDIKVRGEEIFGQFQTNDPRWRSLLEEGMGELTGQLQSMGLKPFLQIEAEPLDSDEKTIVEGMEEKTPYLLSVLV